MSLRDYLLSVVRTVVPTVVGMLIAVASDVDITLPENELSVVVTALFVGGYHAVTRLLEQLHPVFGFLLGWAAKPNYEQNGTAAVSR